MDKQNTATENNNNDMDKQNNMPQQNHSIGFSCRGYRDMILCVLIIGAAIPAILGVLCCLLAFDVWVYHTVLGDISINTDPHGETKLLSFIFVPPVLAVILAACDCPDYAKFFMTLWISVIALIVTIILSPLLPFILIGYVIYIRYRTAAGTPVTETNDQNTLHSTAPTPHE